MEKVTAELRDSLTNLARHARGEKWPVISSGNRYCVTGRGIVPDGCGSTAAAVKLMASDTTAAATVTATRRA